MKESKMKIVASGGLLGFFAAILVKFGNPLNMGVCIACFYRDIAGALGLHRAAVVQYLRPEIPGFILGSFGMAKAKGEFHARGGSSPVLRFVLGFFLMIGALVFLGCPLRMILRLANGDLNAFSGLLGYIAGIWIGIQFLKRGFSLGRSMKQTAAGGYTMPIFAMVLISFLIMSPVFIFSSESGPGAMKAPIALSLGVGFIIGAVLQRTRLCTAGAIRDVFLIKDFHYLWGLVGIFLFAFVGNIILNFEAFQISFTGQPIAHNDFLWNFLGMTLAGITAVFLGGCPLRQTILAGEGDGDAVITIFGLITGAAFAHNFGLAASPQGVGLYGKVAVFIGLVVVMAIGYGVIKSVEKQNRIYKEKGGVAIGMQYR